MAPSVRTGTGPTLPRAYPGPLSQRLTSEHPLAGRQPDVGRRQLPVGPAPELPQLVRRQALAGQVPVHGEPVTRRQAGDERPPVLGQPDALLDLLTEPEGAAVPRQAAAPDGRVLGLDRAHPRPSDPAAVEHLESRARI